jgi:hypothetical protein
MRKTFEMHFAKIDDFKRLQLTLDRDFLACVAKDEAKICVGEDSLPL